MGPFTTKILRHEPHFFPSNLKGCNFDWKRSYAALFAVIKIDGYNARGGLRVITLIIHMALNYTSCSLLKPDLQGLMTVQWLILPLTFMRSTVKKLQTVDTQNETNLVTNIFVSDPGIFL